jgi:hypothetical protein
MDRTAKSVPALFQKRSEAYAFLMNVYETLIQLGVEAASLRTHRVVRVELLECNDVHDMNGEMR